MYGNGKIVDFFKYCKLCKHFKVSEDNEPCSSCLEEGVRDESRKPILWEEANENNR